MLKVAIVTGHSRGLGAALAAALVQAQYRVLGLARSVEVSGKLTDIRQVALDLADADAVSAWLAGADLADFVAAADEIWLFNNAGTVVPNALCGHQGAAQIARAVQLNVTAPMQLADALLRLRPARAAVNIVHISSGAGRRAMLGWSVYGATKAALDLHAQVLAAEQHAQVRVVSLAPGVVDTQVQAAIRGSDEAVFPLRQQFVDLQQHGGLVSAEDTANKIVAWMHSAGFGQDVVADIRTVRL